MLLDPPEVSPVGPTGLLIGLAIFGAMTGYFLHLLVSGRPRILLDETGVTFDHPFVGKRWRWAEIAGFELEAGLLTNLFMRVQQIRVLRRRTASLAEPGGFTGPLSDRERISLQFFAEGRNRLTAQQLVGELEDWRQRHGER